MKKYWIKDLTEKQCIHAPTQEIANKLCERFHELGLRWDDGWSFKEANLWYVNKKFTIYYPTIGKYGNITIPKVENYEVLTINQLLDFQVNEYPKVMEVSHDNHNWYKRVVFMEKNGKFLSWNYAETIKEAESVNYTSAWSYAREIQPLPSIELTVEQIAEKFNVSPEQIKIKK